MSVTLMLERDVKPVAANRNLTHEDFVDQLDRIEPAQTPMTTFCRNFVSLKATERKWTVDKFPDAKGAVGRADGEAAGTGRSWMANMRPIGNIGQGFDEQFGIGWIADAIPQVAGVSDPLAYAKASAYLMLKQHMEVAFCSFDQTAIAEQSDGLGSLGAGYRALVDYANRYTAFSSYAIGKPSDLHYAPTAAAPGSDITAFTATGVTLTSIHSRAMWKTVSYALRTAAKRRTDWTLIAGLALRQAITDLTEPEYSTATSTAASAIQSRAAAQVRVFSRSQDDNVLGASVDVIHTDFGRIYVTESDYIGTTKRSSSNTAITNVDSAASARANSVFNSLPHAGIILDRGNVFKSWGVPPYTEELAKTGGGKTYDAKCYAMLGVSNPVRAGFVYASAA